MAEQQRKGPSPHLWKGLQGMGAWFSGKGPQWEYTQQQMAAMEEERRAREEAERAARNKALQAGGQELAAFTFGQIRDRLARGDMAGVQEVLPLHLRGMAQMDANPAALRSLTNLWRDPAKMQEMLPQYVRELEQMFPQQGEGQYETLTGAQVNELYGAQAAPTDLFRRGPNNKLEKIGSGMQINMPAPAPAQGYQNVYDEQGRLVRWEPIPGGPVATARERQDEQADIRGGRINRLITNVRENLANPTFQINDTTGGGAVLAGVVRKGLSQAPGTPEYELARNLDALKNNIAFSEIQAMRQSSPTGGAVGQLTDKEREAMGSLAGSLDVGLRTGSINETVDQIERETFLYVHGKPEQVRKAFAEGKINEQAYRSYINEFESLFSRTGMPTVSTKAQYDSLPPGATFIDAEDGKTYRKPAK